MLKRSDFLLELIRRRLVERYVGSTSIVLWMLWSPLMPLLINLTIFYFVARIPEIQTMGLARYAVFAFSGLMVFRVLQRAIAEGCDLLAGNLDVLRSVNFPLAYLSLASVGALTADLVVQLVFMAALLALSGANPGLPVLALPIALGVLLILAVGTSWLVSIAGYLAREAQEVLTVVLTLLLYVSPAVYPIDAAPSALRPFIELNPLSHFVLMFRDVLLPSEVFHWRSWIYATAIAAGVFALGSFAIHRLQRFVGDLV